MKCAFCGTVLDYWQPTDAPLCDTCLAKYDVDPATFEPDSEDRKRAKMVEHGGPVATVTWSRDGGGYFAEYKRLPDPLEPSKTWRQWADERRIA
jgi:hypothetical protein